MADFLLGLAAGLLAGLTGAFVTGTLLWYRSQRHRRRLGGRWHRRDCLLVRFPGNRIEGVPGARMWCTCEAGNE